jgi:hypothetical protein
MKRKGLLIALGLVGVAASATGCKDQVARDLAMKAQGDATKALDTTRMMDGYLRDNYAWEVYLTGAVCQLEVNNTHGLDPAKRICVGSPPDVKSPPVYPPK